MKYFLLPDGDNYQIIKVQPADIGAFRKKYQPQIQVEADSIAELLVLFSVKMKKTQHGPQG